MLILMNLNENINKFFIDYQNFMDKQVSWLMVHWKVSYNINAKMSNSLNKEISTF